MSLLAVENLTVGFDSGAAPLRVVEETSFALDAGSTMGLVGESGCGKSVTARAILRLLDWPLHIAPSSRVFFDGQDLGTLPERGMRQVRGRDIAMIFQDPMSALNPFLTIGTQLLEGE